VIVEIIAPALALALALALSPKCAIALRARAGARARARTRIHGELACALLYGSQEARMGHLWKVAIGVAFGAILAVGEVRLEAALAAPLPVVAAPALAAPPSPMAPPAVVSIAVAPELPPAPQVVARRKAKPPRRPRTTQGTQISPAPQKPKNVLDAALAP
jgi:hypothetical protein